MEKINYIILTALLFSSITIDAKELSKSDFKIKKYSGDYFLQKKDYDLKLYKLKGVPAGSKVKKIIKNPKAKHLYFIVYLSSYAGSQVVASHYDAAIWNEKTKQFQGSVLYQIIANEGDKEREHISRAEWNFGNGKMIVTFDGKQIDEVSY